MISGALVTGDEDHSLRNSTSSFAFASKIQNDNFSRLHLNWERRKRSQERRRGRRCSRSRGSPGWSAWPSRTHLSGWPSMATNGPVWSSSSCPDNGKPISSSVPLLLEQFSQPQISSRAGWLLYNSVLKSPTTTTCLSLCYLICWCSNIQAIQAAGAITGLRHDLV